MDFFECLEKRTTSRMFQDKEVDFKLIEKILKAGNTAPTWNHKRNWSYIILKTKEEKELAFSYAKKLAQKFNAEKYLNTPRPYKITSSQIMYAYAMPKQYSMLLDCPYVIIPVFKGFKSDSRTMSGLNPFSTIWCVIENIFLATTALGLGCSMRIPLTDEHEIVKKNLNVPPTYMLPVFIGIGYKDPNEIPLDQDKPDLNKQIHYGKWK